MDTTIKLNHKSPRSKKARLAKNWNNKSLILSLKITTIGCLIIGSGLLVAKYSAGWLIFIPAVICYMLATWVDGDLNNYEFGPNNQGVDQLLQMNTLGKLKTSEPSVYELWQALDGSEESYFIGNRFLIDKSFFETFTDKTAGSASDIWPIAENYRLKYDLKGYTNMVLLVAIVAKIDNIDQILKTIQIELKDLETAIPWMRDVLEKRQLAKNKNFMGGIGRDWAYGYTPILRNLGYNITRDIEAHGFFSDTSRHHQIVNQIIQMMNNGPKTVTLVGDAGVGKTTCVHAFAEHILTSRDVPKNIEHNQIVQLDAPTILSRASNPGQLEDLMIRIFNEAHSAKNIILFFDDAESFFGSGPSSIDLSDVILPAVESSGIKIILAMSPASWQRLSGSSIGAKLQPLNIAPADEENTLAVLRDSISLAEYKNKAVFTYTALKEAYKLGIRYVNNIAMPGAGLSVLEQAATLHGEGLITKEAVRSSVEQTYGIKLQASTTQESSKLLNLEEELHRYVINQNRAVTVVADALRRARSGVGNPDRPVGTFLFLGPTGVGKTELSKALARVYFGDESALIRLDMNQYVQSGDVARLIQPMIGSELGFLGQVRKSPFSVILLDEIEKADKSVVNALLQMLDEGEMRDSDNKSVSFKDAIIIATSNAGADKIRQIIDSGDTTDNKEDEFVESLINDGFFAPELINRFDEVVIFKPLTEDELLQVIDIIVDGINKSLDSQKVQVILSQDAKKWLVDKGYDSKLGARPMRRMAQRYIENIVAKKLLSHELESGQDISLDSADFESM